MISSESRIEAVLHKVYVDGVVREEDATVQGWGIVYDTALAAYREEIGAQSL